MLEPHLGWKIDSVLFLSFLLSTRAASLNLQLLKLDKE